MEEHNIVMTYKKRLSGLLGTNKRRMLKTEKKSDAWLDCLKKLGYGLLDK